MKKLLAFLLLAASVAQGQTIRINGGGVGKSDTLSSVPAYVTGWKFKVDSAAKAAALAGKATVSQIDSALNANAFVLRNSKSAGDSGLVAAGNNGFLSPKYTYSSSIGVVHGTGDSSRYMTVLNKADSATTAAALAGKQATLANQTNIKSINGTSLLGSGDLTISGTAGSISYDTTQNFYFDTTSKRLVIKQGGMRRRFSAFDSLSTVSNTTLTTPGSFTATPFSSTQINLAWTDVSNETNYLLERSPNGSSSWTTVTSPAANSTSYSNTGLTASTAYYYRLSAIGNGTTYLTSGYASANATTSGGSNPNLLGESTGFAANTYWTHGSMSNDLSTAPDGTTTATNWVDQFQNGVHSIEREAITANSTQYTFSVYAKANGRNFLFLTYEDNSVQRVAFFNVSTGAVATTTGSLTTSISSAANGFYRCSITFTSSANATSFNKIQMGKADVDNVQAYTGGNQEGIILWGAQLELGTITTYQAKP